MWRFVPFVLLSCPSRSETLRDPVLLRSRSVPAPAAHSAATVHHAAATGLAVGGRLRVVVPHRAFAVGGRLAVAPHWAGGCAVDCLGHDLLHVLAKALAPEIRVNTLAPGFIAETRWWSVRPDYAQRREQASKSNPLGRAAMPEDVVEAVLLFATSAHFVTGAVVNVDGGSVIA